MSVREEFDRSKGIGFLKIEVQGLISLINESRSYSSLDDFSEADATAYYELSEDLKKRLLHPRYRGFRI